MDHLHILCIVIDYTPHAHAHNQLRTVVRVTHERSKIIRTNFMDRRRYSRELNHL